MSDFSSLTFSSAVQNNKFTNKSFWVTEETFKTFHKQISLESVRKMAHFNYLLLCVWFISIFSIEKNEAKPQYNGRILFNRRNDGYVSQSNDYRQGTIDEFLAIRSTTSERPTPCYPQQYSRRNKRSPHFKRKRVIPIYPVVVNNHHYQYVPTKPPYSHYGGYYCGNHQPATYPHHNLLSHLSNLFLGIFDDSPQHGTPSAGYNDIRPVYEDNEADNGQNEVTYP